MEDITKWVKKNWQEIKPTTGVEPGIFRLIVRYWWGTGETKIYISGFETYDTDLAYRILKKNVGVTFIDTRAKLVAGMYFQTIQSAAVVDNATVRKLLQDRCLSLETDNGCLELQFTQAPIDQQVTLSITGFPADITRDAARSMLICGLSLSLLPPFIPAANLRSYFYDYDYVTPIEVPFNIVCVNDNAAAMILRQKRFKWIQTGLDQKISEWYMEIQRASTF